MATHPMLNIAIQAARSAAKIIVQFVDRLDMLNVTEKQSKDFVTQVDKLSEQEIIATIRKAYPDHSILAEESGENHGSKDEFQWIIDPLDGTANFIHGLPQFGISIALRRRNDLEVGLVYDPLRQEMFTAVRGSGAQLNNRRIRVSNCKKMENALIGTGFPFKSSHHMRAYMKIFRKVLPESCDIRRAGAAALDLAYVAAGRLDGFWELDLKPWDIAAGSLLVSEAGGIIKDIHGEQQFLENGNVVAGNPKIYKSLLKTIEETLQE